MQQVLCLFTVQGGVPQIHEDQVDVGSPGQHRDSCGCDVLCREPFGEQAGPFQGALLTFAEFLPRSDLEGHCLAGDGMHQGSTLLAGEDVGVGLLIQLQIVGQDQSRARPGQGLMHRGGHDVCVFHGVRVQAGGDESSEVGHIDPQERADLIGDRAEGCEVQLARVGGPAGDDHLGLLGNGLSTQLVHIDGEGLGLDLIGGDRV